MLIDGYDYVLETSGRSDTVVRIKELASGEVIERGFDSRATRQYQDRDGFFSLDSFINFIRDIVAECTYVHFEEGY